MTFPTKAKTNAMIMPCCPPMAPPARTSRHVRTLSRNLVLMRWPMARCPRPKCSSRSAERQAAGRGRRLLAGGAAQATRRARIEPDPADVPDAVEPPGHDFERLRVVV